MVYVGKAALLDEIASIVVISEPSNPEVVTKLQGLFQELLTWERVSENEAVRKSAESILSRLAELIQSKSKAGGDVFTAISQFVTALQTDIQLMQAEPSIDGAQGTSSGSKSPKGFRLPDIVDKNVFPEFLVTLKQALEKIEEDTLALERGDKERLGEILRNVHTLKGETGLMGMDDLAAVCHALEAVLDKPCADAAYFDRLFQANDWMYRALESYTRFELPEPRANDFIGLLEGHSPALPVSSAQRPTAKEAPAVPSSSVLSDEASSTPSDSVAVRRPEKVTRDEETIALIVEFLQESEDGLSVADQILINVEREGCTAEKVNALFRVFHTIKGVAGFLELQPISTLAHTTETLLNQVRQKTIELKGPIVDLVLNATAVMRRLLTDLRSAVQEQRGLKDDPSVEPLTRCIEGVIKGDKLWSPQEVIAEATSGKRPPDTSPKPASSAPAEVTSKPATPTATIPSEPQSRDLAPTKPEENANRVKVTETVRVDLERVDNLLAMIGELVIVESMVVHAPEITGLSSPHIRNYLGQLSKICRDLQDVGMRMRMVPVRGVFQKMTRMVRDLSRKSNKAVRIVLSGESTEVDRSMVEQISDPLVHMIRNSMDHGIENAEQRRRVGKPSEGTIFLSAFHHGGCIVIEIRDDGKGLDKKAILDKALAQGLIKEGISLSEDEIFNLIFLPGFSTAKEVTDISGRGVGMDVVRRNVEAMRGRVQISSVAGQGATFKMVLPLTLAIIDGMLVACGPERYIIPTLSIVESIKPDHATCFTLTERAEMINVRGDILPLFRLDQLFDIPNAKTDLSRALVVIVESMGKKLGLLVDDVLTQQQVVIKTLGPKLRDAKHLSGAAILPDGRVGLIINVDEICGLIARENSPRGNPDSERNQKARRPTHDRVQAPPIEEIIV